MTIVTRTEQIQFNSDTIIDFCLASNRLYNAANYVIRQKFFEEIEEPECNDKIEPEIFVTETLTSESNIETHVIPDNIETKPAEPENVEKKKPTWIRYNELWNIMKTTPEYKSLPAQTAQQVLKILDRNWKSFFKAIKEWKAHPEKFTGRPKLPKYKNKTGKNLLVFTNQQCKIQNGFVKFPKLMNFEIRTRLKDIKLNQVRIIPRPIKYVCEIIYEKEVTEVVPDSNRVIGIDLGLKNVVTIANNFGERPIIVKGGIIKSINQFYNKERVRLQKIYSKNGIQYGGKLAKLDHVRNNKVKDFFHKLSRFIIDYAKDNTVKTIVISDNKELKTNNLSIVTIPFISLIHMVQYKAEEIGINVIVKNESYTSKCSFLDNEPVEPKDEYIGERIARGLFRSAQGVIINADVNAALNLIRKVVPDAFADGIEGTGLCPQRRNITSFKKSSSKN